jgi:hypothetical protein
MFGKPAVIGAFAVPLKLAGLTLLVLALIATMTIRIGADGRVPRNPPLIADRTIEAHLTVPKDVEHILARSCKDCHSFETRWPWYSKLPVVSGFLGKHIEKARSKMNLSDWSSKMAEGKDEERATLNGICEELRSNEMPITSYRWLHWDAHLTPAEIETVCNWTATSAKLPLQELPEH